MGANLPAKKYRKGTPSVTKLNFEFDGEETAYISISQALSGLNRRMYRQGLYYYVNSVEVHNAESAVVDLYTAPDTWVTRAAWKRGFEIFRKMQSNALQNNEISVGAYNDFKVGLDRYQMERWYSQSDGLGLDANNPESAGGGLGKPFIPPVTYEAVWASANMNKKEHYSDEAMRLSEFVSSQNFGTNQEPTNPTQFFSHIVGDNQIAQVVNQGLNVGFEGGIVSAGLIHSYQDTRETVSPSNENAGVDLDMESDLLMNLFTTGSENEMADILDDIIDTDLPPYDIDLYPGATNDGLQHVARLSTDDTDVGRVTQAAGFCAPCGLIKVHTDATTGFRLVLNLAVGTYHGVYAERMV